MTTNMLSHVGRVAPWINICYFSYVAFLLLVIMCTNNFHLMSCFMFTLTIFILLHEQKLWMWTVTMCSECPVRITGNYTIKWPKRGKYLCSTQVMHERALPTSPSNELLDITYGDISNWCGIQWDWTLFTMFHRTFMCRILTNKFTISSYRNLTEFQIPECFTMKWFQNFLEISMNYRHTMLKFVLVLHHHMPYPRELRVLW